REFKSPTDFKARLTGASVLKGTLEASRVEVDANGASKVSLKGAANGADLKATGASQLDLSDFALLNATVHLVGASQATVNARAKLDYELSGASRLKYRGRPAIGKHDASGTSSASRE